MAGSLFYQGVTEIRRVEATCSGITPGTLPYVSGSLLCDCPTAQSCLLHPRLTMSLCFPGSAEPQVFGVSLALWCYSDQA